MIVRTIKIQSLIAAFLLATSCMLASAEEAYTLNPGDVLEISVWDEEALQKQVMVLPDSTISFPLVGILSVASKTPAQLQDHIKEKLSRVIPDPEINVAVISVSGNNIFIIGKVTQPGKVPLFRPTDVMQALSQAGGMTPYAKSDEIRILRRDKKGKLQIINFDYELITKGKALESNILLQSGDTIVVP
jgi:polysaccharide export outer membrane protein